MNSSGKREVAEAVITAALVAVVTALVQIGHAAVAQAMDRAKKERKRRKKAND